MQPSVLRQEGTSFCLSWVKFQLLGRTAYLPILRLNPLSKNQDAFTLLADINLNELTEEDSIGVGHRKSNTQTEENHVDRSRLRSRRQIIHHVGSVQETVPEMNTGQNFLISEKQSSDIAVQNGSGSEDDTRSRKMRKPSSDFSVKEQEAVDGESDTEGSELGASVSAIFIGSVCAGVFILPCVITILACLW